MSTERSSKSHVGAIVGVIVVIVIIVAAFVPMIPRNYSQAKAITQVVPTSSAITLTSVEQTSTVVTRTQTTTETNTIFGITSYTLPAGNYVYQSAQLQTGQAVSATWSAQNTVNVYIFDSAQYSAYQSSGTTTAEASQTGAQQGTIGFVVAFPDTYYLAIYNPHNGFLGLGSQSVGIYSASGTATSPQVVYSYSTSSYNTAILSTSTSYYDTSTVTTITTTASCNQNLVGYLTNAGC